MTNYWKSRSKPFLGIILGIIFFSFNACDQNKTAEEICGLASPVFLTNDSVEFRLNDYFQDLTIIESVIFPDNLLITEFQKNVHYLLKRTTDLPPLEIIHVRTSTGNNYEILIKNLKSIPAAIKFDPGQNSYQEVKVRGSLNRWNVKLSNMSKTEDGIWEEKFMLPPGEYQYLIVADGKEMRDPATADSIDNNMGGFNSLLKVGNYQQENLPFISTLKFGNGKIVLDGSTMKKVIGLWQNMEVHVSLSRGLISVEIPSAAKGMKRSFLRVTGYNDAGISNDVLIPLEYGRVITNPSQLTRDDRHTMLLYFMMIDRFYDGSKENNKPVADKDILPKANYFGGDMQGITKKISAGYFDSLGINSIWLSPVTQNPLGAYGLYRKPYTKFSGYHGYWPISSTKIDFRLGDSIAFIELINVAHSHNMNVLLDYVASHVHELHPVYKLHPDWVTPLYLPDGTMNTERWDEYRLTTWFDTFLPKLDLSDPKVADAMSDSALYWLQSFGLDGFRHDATKHIDELFWRILTSKIKALSKCNPMPYQIGETYGSPELISSYIGTGMLDAQFDFNVYDDAVAVFARNGESFNRLKSSLTQSLRYYGYHNLMGYISGNQDRPRFISLAGGELKFDEDSKFAGWNRDIGVGDSTAYLKLMLLQAFNLTIPGIPTIYYGDEIGLPGGNDPDNRRWMKFENLNSYEKKVFQFISKLASERRNNMALLYGDLKFLQADRDAFVYMRTYFDELAIMVFNKSDKPLNVTIENSKLINTDLRSLSGNIVESGQGGISIEIPPLSFDLLTK